MSLLTRGAMKVKRILIVLLVIIFFFFSWKTQILHGWQTRLGMSCVACATFMALKTLGT